MHIILLYHVLQLDHEKKLYYLIQLFFGQTPKANKNMVIGSCNRMSSLRSHIYKSGIAAGAVINQITLGSQQCQQLVNLCT